MKYKMNNIDPKKTILARGIRRIWILGLKLNLGARKVGNDPLYVDK